MFPRLTPAGFVFALLVPVASSSADEKVTLAVPGIQCPRCVESITGTLTKLDPTMRVTATVETKQLEVTYDQSKVTLHQVVSAVSEAPPVHNKPYEAGVLVTVEDPVKSSAKLKKALGQVKGVTNFMAVPGGTAESGDIMIVLRALPRNTKPTDQVKASQISDALEKNGVKFSGLPSGTTHSVGDEPDAKKKTGPSKTTAKSKGGFDEMPAEKNKLTRPTPSSPKTKPSREPSVGHAKPKDEASEDRPRFAILGGSSGKVYLVDHEAKTDDGKELKKLVKEGDKFGDYIVKEVGDDDGLYVVLEQPETKDTVRVAKKKDKEKDGDKPKEQNETKSKGDK